MICVTVISKVGQKTPASTSSKPAIIVPYMYGAVVTATLYLRHRIIPWARDARTEPRTPSAFMDAMLMIAL